MNYSTAVFLINNKVRAIKCTYEADDKAAKRTLFKTMDETIRVGDFVIVPTDTRHNMTVCKVVEVDVDVNFEDPTKVDWIIGTVDRSNYEEVLAQEDTAIQKIKAAELRKKREDLRDSLLKNHMAEIETLPIADMSGASSSEAKPLGQPQA